MGWLAKTITGFIGACVNIVLAKGLLLWLASHAIHPEQWIASGLGLAESAIMSGQAATWIILGIAGLFGLWLGPHLWAKGRNLAHQNEPSTNQQRELFERDISLLDVIHYIVSRRWDWTPTRLEEWAKSNLKDLQPAIDLLQQAAADGALPVWGRPFDGGVLEQIPTKHWRKFHIEFLDVLRGNKQTLKTALNSSSRHEPERSYSELMTSKSCAERLWPTDRPMPETLESKRRKWEPSLDCIRSLKEWREIGRKVEITRHDKHSFPVAQRLAGAFADAGWSVVFHKEIEDVGSPHYVVGIKIIGGSRMLVNAVANALECDGLLEIDKIAEPDNYPDSGTLKIRVGIEE